MKKLLLTAALLFSFGAANAQLYEDCEIADFEIPYSKNIQLVTEGNVSPSGGTFTIELEFSDSQQFWFEGYYRLQELFSGPDYYFIDFFIGGSSPSGKPQITFSLLPLGDRLIYRHVCILATDDGTSALIIQQ